MGKFNAASVVVADAKRMHSDFIRFHKDKEPLVVEVTLRFLGDEYDMNRLIALVGDDESGLKRLSEFGYSDEDIFFFTGGFDGFIKLCEGGEDDFAITGICAIA